MRNSIVRYLVLALLVLFMHAPLSLAGDSLRIATGSETGTYHRFGRDMADVAKEEGLTISVVESEGSMDNITMMELGRADIAIVQSDVLEKIYKLKPQIAEHLRVIFPLYNEEVHILAQRSINSIGDLKRRKVATGGKGSGTYMTLSTLLFRNFVGKLTEVTDISASDATIAVLTGELDAVAYVAGKPVTVFKNLEKMAKDPRHQRLLGGVHFIPISYDEMYRDYYVASNIGPGDYSWLDRTTPTLGVRALLVTYYEKADVTHNDCDPRLLKLVKIINKNIGRLRATGHVKWKDVDLGAKVARPWKTDPSCGSYGVNVKDLQKLLR